MTTAKAGGKAAPSTAKPVDTPDQEVIKAKPAAITTSGQTATTVEVRDSDFANAGITHHTVVFDFRVNDCKVEVGEGSHQISKEAADFLTKNYSASFEYVR